MNNGLLIDAGRKKALRVLGLGVAGLVAVTLLQDFLRARVNDSGYYFSESFLFSSFWWLFAPLLAVQHIIFKRLQSTAFIFRLLVVPAAAVIHLAMFPVLVWSILGVFFDHTFEVLQTLQFAFSEHLYQLAVIYSIPLLLRYRSKTVVNVSRPEPVAGADIRKIYPEWVLLTEGSRKFSVPVSEILYLSAQPPYTALHVSGRRHLANGTLKSFSAELDPARFVRIHKSTIINIGFAESYTSRHNGDYDVMMNDGTLLRVSRNFARGFKDVFESTHRLAAE